MLSLDMSLVLTCEFCAMGQKFYKPPMMLCVRVMAQRTSTITSGPINRSKYYTTFALFLLHKKFPIEVPIEARKEQINGRRPATPNNTLSRILRAINHLHCVLPLSCTCGRFCCFCFSPPRTQIVWNRPHHHHLRLAV